MKLSMWILADWLKKYRPQLRIREGKRVLRNVRLFSSDMRMEAMDAYVGPMGDFIDGEGSQVICVHGHDMILLETEDINQIFNEILDAFDYYNGWSDGLYEQVRRGADLAVLLESSRNVFGHALMIADPGYVIVAKANMEELEGDPNAEMMESTGIMLLSTIQAINGDPRIRKKNSFSYIMDYDELGMPCICRNLFSRNRHIVWVLCAVPEETVSMGQRQLLDELGDIVEYWSGLHEDRLQLLSYTDIFQEFLSGHVNGREQELRLRSIGWFPEDEKQVYVLAGKEGGTMPEYYHRKLERMADGCFAVKYQEETVLIVNRKIALLQDFRKKLEDFMRRTGSRCGVSPVFTDLLSLPEKIRMAGVAVEYGSKEPGSITPLEDCAVSYAVELLKTYARADLIHPALYELTAYDEKNHAELTDTLEAYLLCRHNYVKTAQRLCIHRNTLLYRLKRIGELTGLDLDREDTELHLLLSFRILKQKRE